MPGDDHPEEATERTFADQAVRVFPARYPFEREPGPADHSH